MAMVRVPRAPLASLSSRFVVAAGLGVAAAQAPPLVVKRSTRAGHEVLVRGFAEFDASCKLKRVQTHHRRRVPPTGGSVETRPGDVVIGPNWVGAADCQGKTLRGVNVVLRTGPGVHRRRPLLARRRLLAPRQTVRAEVEVARPLAALRAGAAHRRSWRAASSFMISSLPPPIIITLTSR